MTSQARIKRPSDPFQLAKQIGDIATGQAPEPQQPTAPPKGRAGGLKGGTMRAQKLSPEKRREIARAAARKRWAKIPESVS